MSKSNVEWVKAEGVDRNGKSLAWWRNKATNWRGNPLSIELTVTGYLSNGSRDQTFTFDHEQLVAAKAKAKQYAADTRGSAMVRACIDVRYEGRQCFDIGEWRHAGPRGYFVWQVDENQAPIDCRGPIPDVDEAYALARNQARTSGAGKSFVVTWGDDPTLGDFEIVKAWKGWAAEVHTVGELPRLGRRLHERR